MACELLLDKRKTVLKGISPALERQRKKRRVVGIKTFGTPTETWLANAGLAYCIEGPGRDSGNKKELNDDESNRCDSDFGRSHSET